MLRVAGVVVLYNPSDEICDNVLSYIDQVGYLYVVDNSEIPCKLVNDIIKFHPHAVKIDKKSGNIGIASALNLAANRAKADGFDLLLMMDQDSRISENFVNTILCEFERDERIGILSPYIVHAKNPKKSEFSGLVEIFTAITSGSVIRLDAHIEIGGFLDKLFIDYVDHEYCLRMKTYKYKILRHNSIYVYHELGKVKAKKLIHKKIFPTNHSPQRWYYRTRNRFYIYKTYRKEFPDYIKSDKKILIKETLKIILFENKKVKKIRMMINGYCDYRKGKFGKFE